jgi:hypothetical protein
MLGVLDSAGERLAIECSLPWVTDLIAEGSPGEVRRQASDVSVRVHVDASKSRFDTSGWELLTRGAWRRHGEVVVESVCTSGFDLHLECTPELATFTFRWRPPARDRFAARLLRSRFHLLARAALTQYPALWWAGTRGRAPLHASACVAGESTPLVVAASGIGRSTLVLGELRRGGKATGDNLAVGDGTTVWGLVEPLRVEGGTGRRMPHGRQEAPMPNRVDSLVPDCFVILERGTSDRVSLSACSAEVAERALVTSTYMAGELRRFWSFAAVLAAGTGLGPAHPPVAQVASVYAAKLPSSLLALGRHESPSLSMLLNAVEAAA